MKKVMAEISARHIHLSQADLDRLFGKHYKLKRFKKLSQPGEYAVKEKVTIITPKAKLRARIIFPVRKDSQIELSITDCRRLGIKPVFRLSGNHKGSPGVQIKGPKGKVKLKKGVIVPVRHMHTSVADAKKWKLRNGKKVKGTIKGPRSVTFNNIIVRVGNYKTRIHLDTDEANAAGILKNTKIDIQV